MTATDLLFSRAPATDGHLLFGDDAQETPALTGELVTELPGITASITGTFSVPSAEAGLHADLPAITASFTGNYSSNTARPTVGSTDTSYQTAAPLKVGAAPSHQDSAAAPAGWAAFWQHATRELSPVEHLLPGNLAHSGHAYGARHQDGTKERAAWGFQHQVAAPVSLRRVGAFENAQGMRDDTLFRHQEANRTKRASAATGWGEGTGVQAARWTDYQTAVALLRAWADGHQEGVPPPPGISTIPVPPIPPVGCYTPDPHLLFSWPAGYGGPALLFECGDYTAPPTAIIVPVQRVYIVFNSASLRRVSDNAVVPTLTMSLSLDTSSWAWGFDATLPMEAQALVEPTTGPVELIATVNGADFRVIAERLSRERTFGRASIRVSGRGRNAVLDAPYSPVQSWANTIDRTANQLAEDVLTYNNVPIGWAVDWQLEDWLVPANVFTHQGTHVSALSAIAGAVGGYLQPHRTDMTVRFMPRYPVAPWDWATVIPDFQLPADVTTRESIEWVNKPEFNRVFVSGQQAGVLGQVTRTGTAGDVIAPMTTDALITHATAARQRGLAILGDTGRIATVGLSLPVLPATGVIDVGKFVRYVDGGTTRTGLVRSSSVTVGASAVDVRQQITLETHA